MLDEYIKRSDAKVAYKKSLEKDNHRTEAASLVHIQEHNHILHILDKLPTADVVEVVHAYWDKDSITGAMCCSNCKMPPPGDAELEDFYESDYCQSCGAKMDGKGD